MYLIFDDTYMITLCQLTEDGTKHLQQINFFRPLLEIYVQGTYVYYAFESGDIDFFEVRSNEDMQMKFMLDRRVS